MAQNHTGPHSISAGIKSVAFLTNEKPVNLIIFVHGFSGGAIATWNDFPSLIVEENQFATSDIFFYGYDSLKTQASNSSLRFYKFLKSLLSPAPNKKRGIGENFNYEKIVLVGHSLGSVLIRCALLDAQRENALWLTRTKMVLFAPAHKGARVRGILVASLTGMLKIFGGIGEYFFPTINDLGPESLVITDLAARTQTLLNSNQGNFTIAHSVIWAGMDKVVYNQRFGNDPVAIEIEDKTHISICKPKNGVFIDPMSIVQNALM